MKKIFESLSKKNHISYIFIPASLLFYEIVLTILTGKIFNFLNFISMIFICIAAGMLFNILSSLFKSSTVNKWIAFAILEISSILFMIAYFVYNTYKNFFNVETVVAGAGGVATEFGSTIVNIIERGWFIILLYEIPVIVFAIICLIFNLIKFEKNKGLGIVAALIILILSEVFGVGLLCTVKSNRIKLAAEYEFDSAVKAFSLQSAAKLDIFYLIFGNSETKKFVMDKQSTAKTDLEKIDEYINSLPEHERNEYTGLFKNKNLIFITVESMSKEMIDEDITPTLFKMAKEGIVFEDYYQPYWNGSTATGEFSNLLGLIPTNGMYSLNKTLECDWPYTIVNALPNQSKYSAAFHNGTYEYYNRNLTHINFGYDNFYANDHGITLSKGWPESDLEMFEDTLHRYIDSESFNVYYMTITGHFPYFKDLSIMVEKYWDNVKNSGYDDLVNTYLASEVDFDKAMEYLINELNKKGIADDTVIVLAPDHYPYGLTKSDAWGTTKDHLPNLFGYDPKNVIERDHNTLIIWSGCLKDKKQITVKEPTSSIDILPTLLNLFDAKVDLRLFAGRDVFSNDLPIVIWPDFSWKTAKTYYLSETVTYGPGTEEDFDRVRTIVRNKINLSRMILDTNYYKYKEDIN